MNHNIGRRALLGAASLAPFAAQAQSDWPNKPVRIVVPFPPGQAADIFTRVIADELSKRWPQRVVVENRAGGASVPGVESVARAAPDGYTLLTGTSGPLGVNPSVMPRLPYDVEKDFAFISNVVMVPLLVIAHPSVTERTIQELAASAKARPGQIGHGLCRPGHQPAYGGRIAHAARRHSLQHRALSRQRPRHCGCHGRQCEADDGFRRLRPAAYPIRPRGFAIDTWWGLVAPAGTPRDVAARLNQAFVTALNAPETRQRFAGLMAEPVPNTPEQFGDFMKAELAKYEKVVKASGAKVD